jgi:tetratricopeptide (TPR) repeat protein
LQAGRPQQAIERAGKALSMRREAELWLWTTADLATLAAAHLDAGDLSRAIQYTEKAIAILDECGSEGPEFPQRDYLIGYRVLRAAGQQEQAAAALQCAYDLVVARAAKIATPALRESFLNQVPINREIAREYQDVKRET